METVRIRNPKAMEWEAFRELTQTALSLRYQQPWEALQPYVCGLFSQENVGVFLTVENTRPVALGVVLLPDGPFDPIPQVVLFHNIGTRAASKALSAKIAAFVSEAGYTIFWGINRTGRPDAVWTKALAPRGWETEPVGNIIAFKATKTDKADG